MSTGNDDIPDWWTEFATKNPVPQAELDHFRAVPWTSRYVEDAAYKPTPAFSRVLKHTGEDYFFSKTLNTASTITHFVCLNLKDLKTMEATPPPKTPEKVVVRKEPFAAPEQPDTIFLLQIGESGLDGHPATLHGGVACAILDETMGFSAMLHNYNLEGPIRQNSLFTVNLNTTYRAPIATPGQLIVRTWLVRREGRKWIARAQIVNEQGTVCTEAEGLWVLVPRSKL